MVGGWIQKLLPANASILDFGSGPGDIAGVLTQLGYSVEAADDLQDPWHKRESSRTKIAEFSRNFGIKFTILDGSPLTWEKESFDMVMLHHVLEHFGDSPRELLNLLLECTKPGGYLFITVPNAVNLRKRLAVLRGKTNHAPYGAYYWTPGPWRGHHREYVRGDLEQLASFLGLEIVALEGYHSMINSLPAKARGLWRLATTVAPGWRDSWYLIARKPAGWTSKLTPPEGSKHKSRLETVATLE